MARFYGNVGFGIVQEIRPGVWSEEESVTERPYYGDTMKNRSRNEKGEHLNDNINVGNSISILADAYANENFQHIKYVCWMGAKWKVTDVEVERPRLILTLSGVWNEQ